MIIYDIKYDNPLLNHKKLLEILKIAKEKAGTLAVSELMNLQKEKASELSEIDAAEEIVDKIIEQNFFLSNENGREFIESVANNFDEKTLLIILEFGRDQDIAEQILAEAETQGTDSIVYTLLSKELPIHVTSDNLENIIGTDELNQLIIVPNGILNSWSNKVYHKIVDYINHLAKNLNEMLNSGKLGNQVAITIALLEEWLGLAASGQRFVAAIPPYYDPNDDDWSNGCSSGSYDGNNSSENNSNGFTALTLLFNGTGYNITDHQM